MQKDRFETGSVERDAVSERIKDIEVSKRLFLNLALLTLLFAATLFVTAFFATGGHDDILISKKHAMIEFYLVFIPMVLMPVLLLLDCKKIHSAPGEWLQKRAAMSVSFYVIVLFIALAESLFIIFCWEQIAVALKVFADDAGFSGPGVMLQQKVVLSGLFSLLMFALMLMSFMLAFLTIEVSNAKRI